MTKSAEPHSITLPSFSPSELRTVMPPCTPFVSIASLRVGITLRMDARRDNGWGHPAFRRGVSGPGGQPVDGDEGEAGRPPAADDLRDGRRRLVAAGIE